MLKILVRARTIDHARAGGADEFDVGVVNVVGVRDDGSAAKHAGSMSKLDRPTSAFRYPLVPRAQRAQMIGERTGPVVREVPLVLRFGQMNAQWQVELLGPAGAGAQSVGLDRIRCVRRDSRSKSIGYVLRRGGLVESFLKKFSSRADGDHLAKRNARHG